MQIVTLQYFIVGDEVFGHAAEKGEGVAFGFEARPQEAGCCLSLVVTFEYHTAGNEIAKEEIPVAVNGYIEAFTQKFGFLYDFAGGAVAGQVEAEEVDGAILRRQGAELCFDFFGIGCVNDAVVEGEWHGFGSLLEQSRKELSAQGGVGQYNELFEVGLERGDELEGAPEVEVLADAFVAGGV